MNFTGFYPKITGKNLKVENERKFFISHAEMSNCTLICVKKRLKVTTLKTRWKATITQERMSFFDHERY